MNDATSKPPADETPSQQRRKPYRVPRLQDFGRLHLHTQGSGGMGEDGALGMTKMSDRSAKENIVHVGVHPLGIGLYLFDYKPAFRHAWGHGRQLGVMADEVEQVMPRAVTVDENGYRVDYAMLGFVHSVD